MKNYEFSLVFFTVLSQFSIGLAVCSAWYGKQLAFADHKKAWSLVTFVMGMALVASLFHLGHPDRAYTTLTNLGTAWLSLEVLLAGLFIGLVSLTFLSNGKPLFAKTTACVGMVLLAVQGATYAPVAQTAIANGVPFALFALTAWVLGSAAGQWIFASRSPLEGAVRRALKTGLSLWLAVMLLVPCVWAAGGTVMRQTAINWGVSPLYWAAVGVSAVTLYLLSRRTQLHPFLVVMALLVVAFLGRLTFFGETASTFSHIGAPF